MLLFGRKSRHTWTFVDTLWFLCINTHPVWVPSASCNSFVVCLPFNYVQTSCCLTDRILRLCVDAYLYCVCVCVNSYLWLVVVSVKEKQSLYDFTAVLLADWCTSRRKLLLRWLQWQLCPYVSSLFLFTKFHMQIITVQITRLLFFDRISPLSTQYCFFLCHFIFFSLLALGSQNQQTDGL